MRFILSFVTIAMLIFGCSPESPKLRQRPPPEKPIVEKEETQKVRVFKPMVDILFVIDDSGSMYGHQTNLANNVGLFANGIIANKSLDFNIGVITTSPDGFEDGQHGLLIGNPKIINRSTPALVSAIANNLRVGTDGGGIESVFDPIYWALTDPQKSNHNAGFLRDEALLAVMVLTDAEDQSKKMSPDSMALFLNTLKGGVDRFVVMSAYISSTATDCSRDDFYTKAYRLERFFKLTNASTISLCDQKFGAWLASVGDEVVKRAVSTFFLTDIPKLDTLRVEIDGIPLANDPMTGWTYNAERNSVEFGPNIDWASFPGGVYPKIFYKAAKLVEDGDVK